MKRLLIILFVCMTNFCLNALGNDPLPSWNEGKAKDSIKQFVQTVTDKKGADFVPVPERIAVFDNDGTLWSEKPAYFQFVFAKDRMEEMAKNPAKLDYAPYIKALLKKDKEALKKTGKEDLLKLITASHAGITTEEYREIVSKWIMTAKHPRFDRLYKELVYQPMLELLEYLRANQFKTYIVSGGGIDFVRVWSEDVYGIPPEQVVGSSLKTKLKFKNGKPVIYRDSEIEFINDGPGKPIGINKHIGRRPIAAFGNSDGDLEMLQWTSTGKGKRFGLIVHHTDEKREWAYDKNSLVGKLDKALIEADKNGWSVVDMQQDWKVIYPFEKQ